MTVVAKMQRQVLLGGVEDTEKRRLTLVEETNSKMERFGDAGIQGMCFRRERYISVS